MDAAKILNILLSATSLAKELGLNYREVMDAQDQAEAEGRDLTDEERQGFIDQAQNAVDQL